ncbi:hypothetical protein KKB11_01870 [Candidatus Micrarchaeota archaeon]|nr:hypothetical protein [Candidatus Micrarchaeota archaeon]
MKKFAVLVFFILFFSLVNGLSSTEVKNFFASESHYLEASQNFSETPFPVSDEGKNYYVIVLISERTPTGFVAVPSDEKKVVESAPINRKLFKTAYVLYSINSYRGTQNWIFSNSNKGKFNTLTKLLSSDVPFKLNSIKQGTTDSSIRNKVDLMNSMLNLMTAKSAEIESAFDEAISLELDFTLEPDTKDTDKLKQEYESVFSLLQEFKDLKLDYSLHVIELKKLISESDIDTSEKQQFLALASEPSQLTSIESIFSLSEDASQRIEEVYSAATSNVGSWVENIPLMIQRNSAYDTLYSDDKDFYSKTKNNFWTLSDAYSYITKEDNSPYWKEQTKLSSLKKNFSEAEKAFEQKNYQQSVSFSEKAKKDAIAVVVAGFYESDNPFKDAGNIVIGLAALLVLLILYNNRKKFLKPKDEIKEFKF